MSLQILRACLIDMPLIIAMSLVLIHNLLTDVFILHRFNINLALLIQYNLNVLQFILFFFNLLFCIIPKIHSLFITILNSVLLLNIFMNRSYRIIMSIPSINLFLGPSSIKVFKPSKIQKDILFPLFLTTHNKDI